MTAKTAMVWKQSQLRGLQLLDVHPIPALPELGSAYIFHITNVIDAVDEEKSEFSYYLG